MSMDCILRPDLGLTSPAANISSRENTYPCEPRLDGRGLHSMRAYDRLPNPEPGAMPCRSVHGSVHAVAPVMQIYEPRPADDRLKR